jgi:NADPH:quinone reductase-like Zn-dependent oxidoreductase
MKAFISQKYGPPGTLRMAEVEMPAPGAGEVLVKVLAVSVNPADWHSMRGKPLFSRATLGLVRPKHKIPGVDIAGRVEAAGGGVTRFKPGEEVYAGLLDHGYGGFAEYVPVPADVISLKPANLSFEEAAAVPMAAVTALQGLRHHGEIQPGQKILINGASGGVGTFAVQIARSCGAEVTGVTSTGNINLVRSLGAHHVVDDTKTDLARSGRRYDLILDTVGNRSVPDLRGALAGGGKAAVVGFTSVARLLSVSLRGGKDIAMVSARVTVKDLEFLSELIEAGQVRPAIDRRYGACLVPVHRGVLEELEPQLQADRVGTHRIRRALDCRQVGKIALGGLHHLTVIPQQRPRLPAAAGHQHPLNKHHPPPSGPRTGCLEGKAFKASGGEASPARRQKCDTNKACPQHQPAPDTASARSPTRSPRSAPACPEASSSAPPAAARPAVAATPTPATCTAPTRHGSARSEPRPSPARSAPRSSSGTAPSSITPGACAS